MSTLAVAALVLVCVWLGVLTLVAVLLVRQVGLLTVRLSVAGQALAVENDGPEVGSQHTRGRNVCAAGSGSGAGLSPAHFGGLHPLPGARGRHR